MKTALWAMIDDADGYDHSRIDEINSVMHSDMQVALCLDPKKIDEEYTLMRDAAFAIGENSDAKAKLREAGNHTLGWKGTAVDFMVEAVGELKEYGIEGDGVATVIDSYISDTVVICGQPSKTSLASSPIASGASTTNRSAWKGN